MQSSNTILNKRSPLPSILQTNSLTNWGDQGELNSAGVQGNTTLGFSSTFSTACWSKNEQTGAGGVEAMFAWRGDPLGGVNSFEMRNQFNSINNLQVTHTDPSQAERFSYIYNNVMDGNTDTWHHYVFTWDGTQGGQRLYVDGVLKAPDTTSPDLDGSTITDTNRDIQLGGRFTGSSDTWVGPIYSIGLWDSVLTSAEAAVLYNGGNARDLDVTKNFSSYTSSGDLIHYYRLGIGTTGPDFGEDRSLVGSTINCTNGFKDTDDLTADIPV